MPGISPRKQARRGAQNPAYQGRGSETASCNSHGPTSSSIQGHWGSELAQEYQRLDTQKQRFTWGIARWVKHCLIKGSAVDRM